MTMLPPAVQPADLEQGYQIQDIVAARDAVAGWKVAATSLAGQNHIGIAHPIAGQLGASCVLDSAGTADMTGNLMQAAEAEFVFEFSANLPAREKSYETDEIMACVGAPAWCQTYGDKVPVLLCGEVEICRYFLDLRALQAALKEPS